MSDKLEFHIEIRVFVQAPEPGFAPLAQREFRKVFPLVGEARPPLSYFERICEDFITAFDEEAETQETLIIANALISKKREAEPSAERGERMTRLREDLRAIDPREAVDALIKEERPKDGQEPLA